MKKTFFEKWQDGEPGYTNLGGFDTKLMQLYQHADSTNRDILEKAYPAVFTLWDSAPGKKAITKSCVISG